MPVYEYQCKLCNHFFQVLLKIGDRKTPIKNPCSQCGEIGIQQLISKSAIIDPFTLGRIKPQREFQEKAKSLNRYYRRDIIKDIDKK